MQIEIQFTSNPIAVHIEPVDRNIGMFGSLVEFRGIVREQEHGQGIRGLRYEIYEIMAKRQLESMIRVLGASHPCRSVHVIHRKGEVMVGETAVYIGITSAHREEGFSLLSALMNRLKQDVPIWKAGTL